MYLSLYCHYKGKTGKKKERNCRRRKNKAAVSGINGGRACIIRKKEMLNAGGEEDTMEEKRFLTIHAASRLWHIEAEELRRRCAEGRIKGAKQVRGIWLIPQ